jgi:hypothetical protein
VEYHNITEKKKNTYYYKKIKLLLALISKRYS